MNLNPLLAAPLMVLTASLCAAQRPPNLVLIVADDLGYGDVGFHGCRDIPTPNLDALAAGGVRFDSGYVTYAVCSPSRAGLLTGRYPQRFGYERNVQYRPNDPNMGLPPEEETLAELLGRAGYVSAAIGKWHLGAHPSLDPLSAGFTTFFGHLGGGHQYFPENLDIADPAAARNEGESYRTWIQRDRTPVPTTKYLTEEFTEAAVSFIEENAEKPFFVYLSYNAPHTPMQATPELLARVSHITNPKRRTYAAMVAGLDDGVGRVLKTLHERDLDENTLVVFLSDNGGPTTANGSINLPLRGGKSEAWEGGWRVPFVIRWTGKLPAGRSYGFPVSALDIFAIMVGETGASVDPERPIDGVNLIPFLTGAARGRPHDAIFLRQWDKGGKAVRVGDFKWVQHAADRPVRLFNLVADPAERTDLAAQRPELVAQMAAIWEKWNAELVEPRFAGLLQEQQAPRAAPAAAAPSP